MSTILLHMVWPYCEFRMHVWNVLHAACWKYRTQKWRQKSPSRHHRTTLLGCIFATKAWQSEFGALQHISTGFALLHGTLVVGVSQTLRRRTFGRAPPRCSTWHSSFKCGGLGYEHVRVGLSCNSLVWNCRISNDSIELKLTLLHFVWTFHLWLYLVKCKLAHLLDIFLVFV